MNKNAVFSKDRVSQRNTNRLHPIWRGVGLVLMIFIPILSYLGSTVILEYNTTENWFPIPPEFIISWQDPYILMKLFITAILCFVIYALFMLVTFFISAMFGPKRYIAPDLPPLKRKRHW